MHEDLRNQILDILRSENLPESEPVIRDIPFPGKLGLALSNVFQIAREAHPDASKQELQSRVDEIAGLIARRLEESGKFERVAAEKGYVNCFFKPDLYAKWLIGGIIERGTDWGGGGMPGGRVMVEYSQPNTHKAFHIGHVRNVALGATLVRCFGYVGRDTVAANYIGDIGAHVFKSLWILESTGQWRSMVDAEPSEQGKWLGECYARADSLLTESKELKDRVWDVLKPLSKALENSWRDDELVNFLGIDPLTRKIALREEDLFENRSTGSITRLLEDLNVSNVQLFKEALRQGKITGDHEAVKYVLELEDLRSHPEFLEIWNREKGVESIAERWSQHDPALMELWRETRRWSLNDFERIYDELGAPFDEDAVFFESEVEEEGIRIVEDLRSQGVVTVSAGARIVEIDKKLHELFDEPERDKYRVLVLVRADGASLYGAKDLALARRKFRDFKIEDSIYVVGSEQKFYFQQVFQILRLMGFPQWEKCFHLSYELVMLPGGKISSRAGNVVLFDDVYRELESRALAVVREKNPNLPDELKASVANDVAKGALLYGMLRVDTNKKINFDFDEVLDFDGRSAPYIQYAATRALSILRKAAEQDIRDIDRVHNGDFSSLLAPVEIDLISTLAKFPRIVRQVVEDKKPIHLATYAYELADAFSNFYHQCPVLTAPPPVLRARLLLVKSVRTTLEVSLGLLGIPSPEVM
jgi:arginyl-tRNA synthetase